MKVVFAAAAAEELDEAITWYEQRRSGLGKRLFDAVQFAVNRLREFPHIGVARNGTRRLPIAGFPYALVFEVEESEIVIIAVAHQRRRPGYWRAR